MSVGTITLLISVTIVIICMIAIYRSAVIGFWNDTDGLGITDVLALVYTVFNTFCLSIFFYKLINTSIGPDNMNAYMFFIENIFRAQAIIISGYYGKGVINNAVNKFTDYKKGSGKEEVSETKG